MGSPETANQQTQAKMWATPLAKRHANVQSPSAQIDENVPVARLCAPGSSTPVDIRRHKSQASPKSARRAESPQSQLQSCCNDRPTPPRSITKSLADKVV